MIIHINSNSTQFTIISEFDDLQAKIGMHMQLNREYFCTVSFQMLTYYFDFSHIDMQRIEMMGECRFFGVDFLV